MSISIRCKMAWSCKSSDIEPLASWITLIAAFLTSFQVGVVSGTFGIIYDDLIDKYNSDRSTVGWVFSCHWIALCVGCYLISPLITAYGCRRVAFIGGLLYGGGMTLACVAPNVLILCIFYGIFGGTGVACGYVSATTIIQQVFTYNRGLATGIVAVGLSTGNMIHSLYATPLLSHYGLFGFLLIVGGLNFHVTLFSLAFNVPKPRIPKAEKIKNVVDKNQVKHTITLPESESGDNVTPRISTISDAVSLTQKSIVTQDIKQNTEMCATKKVGGLKYYCKGIIDFSPMKKPTFALCAFHFFFIYITRLGLSSHIVSAAKLRGIPLEKAVFLQTIIAAATICARAISAVIMNFSWLNPSLYSVFATCCAVISGFTAAYSQSFASFTLSVIFLGLADGIVVANLAMLLMSILPKQQFSRGLGLVWLITAPAPVGSAPFVGWLVDIRGNYYVAFSILGISGIASMLLAFGIFLLKRRDEKRKKKCEETNKSTENIITRL